MNRMNCIKNTTSIRKLAYIFTIICLFSLTGCMSKEEKEKAKNNETLARPIVQDYLKMNYGSGEIKSLDSLNRPKRDLVLPDFSKITSSYVKSSVIVNKKEFSVITNVETGQCYDNYNEQLVVDALKNYTASSLSIDAPYDIEVHYYLKDLDGELNGSSFGNFTEYGITSVDDLFKNDQYQIYLICKYVASDMDFGSVDTKRFFPASEVSDVYLALLNFRSKDRYNAGDMVSLDQFYFGGPNNQYSLSDVVTAYKVKAYDSESKKSYYDDNVNYRFARYLSKSINGIEFVWNDIAYALDFEVVPAEKEIQMEDHSGKTFYSTDGKAISVECTFRLDKRDDEDDRIYCYFDKALNKREMIVTDNNSEYRKYDLSTLQRDSDGYIYDALYIYNKEMSYTLGFYKRR